MTSLWWPGDHRAGNLMTDEALLEAMLSVEAAWSRVLVESDIAPSGAEFVPDDLELNREILAVEAESSGSPVLGLVRTLRQQLGNPAAHWIHRGLTSQDVIDTAIMLCSRDAIRRLRDDIDTVVDELVRLIHSYRSAPMMARTLTQPAVPTTFGAKVAAWLRGTLDAREQLAELSFPAQLGGAAGTLSGLVQLGDRRRAASVRAAFGPALGLESAAPWHTERHTVTKIGTATAAVSGAYGRIANDIVVLARPEVGELGEAAGGKSSTMPEKANPMLSILVRRQALSAPQLVATLHIALALQVDERADGAWHAEWAPLSTLLRQTIISGAQMAAVLPGLRVDTTRMALRVSEFDDVLRAEQRLLADISDGPPQKRYDGLTDDIIDQTLEWAYGRSEEIS